MVAGLLDAELIDELRLTEHLLQRTSATPLCSSLLRLVYDGPTKRQF
jgi:hypothetical protein